MKSIITKDGTILSVQPFGYVGSAGDISISHFYGKIELTLHDGEEIKSAYALTPSQTVDLIHLLTSALQELEGIK